jgi:hypothetical protein
MSWYVYQLLANSQQIREGLYKKVGRIDSEGDIIIIPESESFDDLLTVETKISELNRRKLLSDYDRIILFRIQDNKSLTLIGKEEGIDRSVLAREVRELCDRLGFLLGDRFTDAGYLNYLQEKYHLTDEETLAAETYIQGKFKIYRGKSEIHNTKSLQTQTRYTAPSKLL